jgi:hypothetical protein
MDVAEVFDDPVTKSLVERSPLMRLAYTGRDGAPRVIPSGYLVRGTDIVMCTVPSSAKVEALRADPRVAVTIDVGGMPPCCLLVRGTAALDEVDGVPDDYLEASWRGMPGTGARRVREAGAPALRLDGADNHHADLGAAARLRPDGTAGGRATGRAEEPGRIAARPLISSLSPGSGAASYV